MLAPPVRRDAVRRGGAIAPALACALVVLAGCSAGVVSRSPDPASGSGDATAFTTVEVGGRPVLLYVPPGTPAGAPAPLVVVLHGYTAEAAGAVEFFGLRPLAGQRGFLIAAPQGTTDPEGKRFWNASDACCNFHGSDVDDSAHLSRVISAVTAAQEVDPARVYVVGHSNGGFMAHTLACEHADQVAAIASLAGAMDADAACTPSRPVSVLQVHGEADASIAYEGGDIDGHPYTSAPDTVARWRRANACPRDGGSRSGAPIDADARVAGDDLAATTWAGCRDGAEVALWTIADGGHNPALTPGFSAALVDWLEARGR